MMYDIFIKLQLGCRPVAVVQYTFTHKQYTEGNKTNNVQNNTTFFGRVRTVPHLCELYPGICLQLRKKHGKRTFVIYVSLFLFTLICTTTLFSTLNYEWAVSVTPLPSSYLSPQKVAFLYSPVFWVRSLFKSKSLLHEHDAVAFLV